MSSSKLATVLHSVARMHQERHRFIRQHHLRSEIERRRLQQRHQWLAAAALSATCAIISLGDAIFLFAAVHPKAHLYTVAIDNTDRSVLFLVVASVMDCSSLVAIMSFALCLVVIRSQRRGNYSLGPIQLALFVHSVVVGLTVAVLVVASVLMLVISVESMWSQVKYTPVELVLNVPIVVLYGSLPGSLLL